jgi:hypothetical protein
VTMPAQEESAVRRRGRHRGPQGLDLGQLPRFHAREIGQSLYVLSRSDQQRLCVHPPEPPRTEAPHPVPLLSLGEHRLNPHLALLAQSLLVWTGVTVGSNPFEELLVEALRISTRPLSPCVHSGFKEQALQTPGSARYLLSLSV